MATERIAEWVARHGFERIALQFPDALLAKAPGILAEVCEALNDRQVFILGDSSFGGGGVDEVGAQHYGADCLFVTQGKPFYLSLHSFVAKQ